jgi:uncharacterized protein (TIGR03435 family)
MRAGNVGSGAIGVVVICVLAAASAIGQPAPAKMEFDVASVKQNQSNARPTSNFPLGPGAMYSATQGVFSATGQPLFVYVMFAYKMTDEVQSLLKQLPSWVVEERYDIQAKSDNHAATKDDMRAMMQTLLAERLKLKVHAATEEVNVYGLVLATPGKLGPKLRPHPADDTTCANAPPAAPTDGSKPAAALPRTVEGGYPVICGGAAVVPTSVPGRLGVGYRNVSLKLIALQMTGFGGLDRPVLDQTGLAGNYDFVLEFTPQLPPDVTPPPDFDTSGPSFQQALASQTGLKLVPQKGPVDVIVVDHIERPSEN